MGPTNSAFPQISIPLLGLSQPPVSRALIPLVPLWLPEHAQRKTSPSRRPSNLQQRSAPTQQTFFGGDAEVSVRQQCVVVRKDSSETLCRRSPQISTEQRPHHPCNLSRQSRSQFPIHGPSLQLRAECGSYESAQSQLLAQRRIMVKAYVERQKQLAQDLIQASDFKALSGHTARVREEMQAEAKACGEAADFDKFCESFLFLDDLSQLAELEQKAKSENSANLP